MDINNKGTYLGTDDEIPIGTEKGRGDDGCDILGSLEGRGAGKDETDSVAALLGRVVGCR